MLLCVRPRAQTPSRCFRRRFTKQRQPVGAGRAAGRCCVAGRHVRAAAWRDGVAVVSEWWGLGLAAGPQHALDDRRWLHGE